MGRGRDEDIFCHDVERIVREPGNGVLHASHLIAKRFERGLETAPPPRSGQIFGVRCRLPMLFGLPGTLKSCKFLLTMSLAAQSERLSGFTRGLRREAANRSLMHSPGP